MGAAGAQGGPEGPRAPRLRQRAGVLAERRRAAPAGGEDHARLHVGERRRGGGQPVAQVAGALGRQQRDRRVAVAGHERDAAQRGLDLGDEHPHGRLARPGAAAAEAGEHRVERRRRPR